MSDKRLNVYNATSLPGRREFYPHHHSDLEVAIFKSGCGTYSITGHEYEIAPGYIFMFSNNEIHKITYVNPDTVMEALNIHFSPGLLLDGEIGELGLSRIFSSRRAKANLITPELAGESYESIKSALLDCEREALGGDYGSELLSLQSLIRALVLVLRSCDIIDDAPPRRDRRRSVESIARVLGYIDENYRRELTLDELCEFTHMSRSNFERLFAKLAGVTVSDYVRRRRIDYATELLRTTTGSIISIALACGYHNTANFNKQFKSVIGKSPGDYRRLYGNR